MNKFFFISNRLFLKTFSCIACLMLFIITVSGQDQKDSIKFTQSKAFKVVAAPTVLIASSLLVYPNNNIFDRFDIFQARQKNLPNFDNHTDDYLQYVPIVTVYGLNVLGSKGKNDLRNTTLLLLKSEIMMMAIVFPLKAITKVERPDGRADNAYPSGHTAQAFVAATFLHKEYGHISPWYSIGAYTVASSVGVLRVLNNRHWISDVLAGAGIGILTTNIAYATHRFRKNGSNSKNRVSIIPEYTNGSMGINVTLPINYSYNRRH